MRIIQGLDQLPLLRNPVVTVGSFDGVHCGHRAILHSLKQLARETDGETVVLTFYPHPRKVLGRDAAGLRLLNSLEEKIFLLHQAGVQNLIIVEFTPDFGALDSQRFVRHILLEKIGARGIVVGYNHHFGRNREGNFDFLERLALQTGIQVREVPKLDMGREKISSTAIREELDTGNLEAANRHLGFPFLYMGKIRPDGNLCIGESCKLILPQGRYRAEVYDAKANNLLSAATLVSDGSGVRLDFEGGCYLPDQQQVRALVLCRE